MVKKATVASLTKRISEKEEELSKLKIAEELAIQKRKDKEQEIKLLQAERDILVRVENGITFEEYLTWATSKSQQSSGGDS